MFDEFGTKKIPFIWTGLPGEADRSGGWHPGKDSERFFHQGGKGYQAMTDVKGQTTYRWTQWLVPLTFVGVYAAHAFYLSRIVATPMEGWANSEVTDAGFLRLYLQGQDYYTGFSYALGAAFAVWAIGKFLRYRQTAMAAGVAGSITFVGVLMAAGCFMIGCCGSPMLGVYLGIFGAKALGIGKPLMALVSLTSVGVGYWYLSRRAKKGICLDSSCACHSPSSEHEIPAPSETKK
jgi:hypothetical protein